MQLGEVTELFGISNRELRSLQYHETERPTNAGGPMNGSVALEAQSTRRGLSPAWEEEREGGGEGPPSVIRTVASVVAGVAREAALATEQA